MAGWAWALLSIVLAVPALAADDVVQDLASSDLAVRRRTATALADEPTLPPTLVAPLVARLRDSDLVVADAAVRALGHCGPPARTALEPLLASSDAELRTRAYQAIGRLVASDPEAWPLVLRAFRDDRVRDLVAGAVAKAGAPAVPELVGLLTDQDAGVRLAATSALAWMGADARPAVPTLVGALRDSDSRVRREAAFALAKVDPSRPETVPALAALLPDLHVACTLFTLDALPTEAAPALMAMMLGGHDGSVCAARALGRLGTGDPAVERALVEALRNPDDTVRGAAAQVLGAWGSAASEAVPDLIRLLSDQGEWLRKSAAEALAQVGAPAVPLLVGALTSDDFYVRSAAAEALANMRPFPEAATDALIRALDDPNEDVRQGASWALSHAEGPRVEAALARFAEAEKRREGDAEPDATRIFSKAEVIAGSPADADHKYPLELDTLAPIEGTDLLAGTYHGRDRAGEVVVWAKAREGYLRVGTFSEEPGTGSYDPITSFRHDDGLFLLVQFVQRAARYAPDYTVYAVGQSENRVPTLTKVEIESPIDWFHDNLRPDESLMDDYFLTVANDRLEWSFMLWKPGDCHAGPTGGGVHGTFDLVEEKHRDDATNRWTSTWRMIVRDGERTPPTERSPTPARAPAAQVFNGYPEVAVGVRLPDGSGALPRGD